MALTAEEQTAWIMAATNADVRDLLTERDALRARVAELESGGASVVVEALRVALRTLATCVVCECQVWLLSDQGYHCEDCIPDDDEETEKRIERFKAATAYLEAAAGPPSSASGKG